MLTVALHADYLHRLDLAQPLLQDQHQGAPAQLLLRRSANAVKVPCVHAQSNAGYKPLVRYIYVVLVRTAPRTLEGRTLDRHNVATAASTAETTMHPGKRHHMSAHRKPLDRQEAIRQQKPAPRRRSINPWLKPPDDRRS